MIEAESGNKFDQDFWARRAAGGKAGGYEKLGWVKSGNLLDKIIKVAALKGNETVVEEGTGSQAVLDKVAPLLPQGRYIGFDISVDMMARKEGVRPANSDLLVADAYRTPFASESVDVVIARMVYHHLDNVDAAVKEAQRILKPGGRLVISEYVASDEEVLAFEREVFDIKEAGRNLWTGGQLAHLVQSAWGHNGIGLDYAVMSQYSVKDWMGKSGLPETSQQAVLDLYLGAPLSIIEKMEITYSSTGEGVDALVNRPFAYVVAEK